MSDTSLKRRPSPVVRVPRVGPGGRARVCRTPGSLLFLLTHHHTVPNANRILGQVLRSGNVSPQLSPFRESFLFWAVPLTFRSRSSVSGKSACWRCGRGARQSPAPGPRGSLQTGPRFCSPRRCAVRRLSLQRSSTFLGHTYLEAVFISMLPLLKILVTCWLMHRNTVNFRILTF